MSETLTPRSRLPWVTAAVLLVVALGAAAALVFVVRPDWNARHRTKIVGLTGTEQQAVDAASKQVINLLTYSRKSFDADYRRAQVGATGALAKDLSDTTKKSTLLSQMTTGKFDLQGQVTASAFEESSGANIAVLVSAQGYKVPDSGSKTLASTARFEVTVTKINGKWLTSNLVSVGLV
jgi:hypothetical protein